MSILSQPFHSHGHYQYSQPSHNLYFKHCALSPTTTYLSFQVVSSNTSTLILKPHQHLQSIDQTFRSAPYPSIPEVLTYLPVKSSLKSKSIIVITSLYTPSPSLPLLWLMEAGYHSFNCMYNISNTIVPELIFPEEKLLWNLYHLNTLRS